MNKKSKIIVEQLDERDLITNKHVYRVVALRNRTQPALGKILSESEIAGFCQLQTTEVEVKPATRAQR